jgi:hypothetical protein
MWGLGTLVWLTFLTCCLQITLWFFVGPSLNTFSSACFILCFKAVSSLKINLAKSELVPVGSFDNVDRLASILGYGISSLPLKYFNLLLGASYKAKFIWDSVIEKIECRLASWKLMYLSKGRRVTVIKCTLSNLPTYFMSLFPASVANRI